jgi:hypothetical protein
LSAIYVDDDSSPDPSIDNVLRSVRNFGKSNDGAYPLEGCCIQVARKPIPSGLSHFPRRHDTVNAE